MGHHVELAQQVHGVEVLVAAVLVGDPLPGLAGVIQVEHGGDRVHAQPVDVELVEPIQGAGEQEVLHLVAPVVEDQGAPVAVLPLARVGVLVQGGAVEAGQGKGVAREVGRHPVEQDTDAVLVQVIDEVAEIVRAAEAAGGGEVARGLVAPGGVQGVFGDGQQLDVGEARQGQIVHQTSRKFPVAQEVAVRIALPGPQVHLVDRHGAAAPIGRGAGRQPVADHPRHRPPRHR